jgi:hypothetical protein
MCDEKIHHKNLNYDNWKKACVSTEQFLNQSARTDHVYLKCVHISNNMVNCLMGSKLIQLH